jgi:hypothetical protein
LAVFVKVSYGMKKMACKVEVIELFVGLAFLLPCMLTISYKILFLNVKFGTQLDIKYGCCQHTEISF